MQPFTLRQRIRYAFDNSMSRGTIALIGWLALASVILILLISVPVWAASLIQVDGGEQVPLSHVIWMSLMRTLDAGTMGGDEGGYLFLFSMLAVTFGGIFVISTLIGVLTSGIEGKLDELRKGRSKVVESEHTVILGWSSQVFSIISELVQANESRKRPCIVVLGEKDKVEMEEEIHDRCGKTGRTRVVCRSGSPIDLSDLDMVSVQSSRSIVVVAPEGDDPDSNVIKTILAITNGPNRRSEPYHIVAEIQDPRNLEVARMVGKNEAELILIGDLIARITAQTCRQSGLSVVFTELLDFGGDEIYFTDDAVHNGKTFGETLFAFEDSAVMGLRFKNGVTQLNPPMDTRIQPGDKLVVIAEDDDAIKVTRKKDFSIDTAAMRQAPTTQAKPERTLILGWNWRVPILLTQLDAYVTEGSEATVVADLPDGQEEIAHKCPNLTNQAVTYLEADTTDRRVLDKLDIPTYHHIIILCSDRVEQQQADAKALVTLLHLRDIADRAGHPFSIVTEMLDARNRTLAEVTKPDDFIVSEKLVSLMLSQISENKDLSAVFGDLFDPEGSEIYLKPASHYVAVGKPVNFYTVLESARRRGEVAIGYRLQALAHDSGKAYGVVVNPEKSDSITFSESDRIVVVAEN